MSENTKEKRKFHLFPQSVGLNIGLCICIIAEIIFLLFIMALDVFPFKYIAIGIGALILIDIGILFLLNSRKKNTVKHIVGLIVIVLLIQVLLVGDIYAYTTYDTLQKISKYKATWEIYQVITLADGSYQTVDDLEGETVNRLDMTSKQLTEASERLVTKAGVKYKDRPDLLSVGQTIIDEDGSSHDNIILVTRSQRQVLNQQITGFKDNTQVIYKIKVKKRADDNSKAVDVTEDSFNVLISGVDVWGKIDQEALSDVNMVMTVNPKTKTIALTSIPRDSYIPLHSFGANDKLTHSGIYGEEETKATIEDFLDIDINYTIRVNFSMLVDIVDAIGGIEVESDYEFDSAIHDSHYKKGLNKLNGKDALYFARERKSFTDGDMQRNKNQQIVLEAIIKKVTSSKVIMTSYTSILNAVEDEMRTDLTSSDLQKLAKLQLNSMDTPWTIKTANIVGSTGSAPCYSMGNQMLSCVFPSEESVEKAKKKIHNTMYPVDNSLKKKQTESTDSSNGSSESSDNSSSGSSESSESSGENSTDSSGE